MCVCVINLIMIHVLPFYRFTLHVQHLPALLSTTAYFSGAYLCDMKRYVNEYNSIHQLNYKTSRGNTFQYINLGASHYQYYQLRVLLK